jgi:putative flippase GtrA
MATWAMRDSRYAWVVWSKALSAGSPRVVLPLFLKWRRPSTPEPMASLEISGSNAGVKLARDLALALVVGFLTGALAIPVVINLGIPIRIPLVLLPIIVAVLFALGLLVASLVAGRAPSLFEFSKFAIVGVLNSGVDFGILNTLILLTGMASGAAFLGFKSISVTLGVINSYLWNKYWTFQVDVSESGAARRELIAFMAVTIAAVAVNVAGADVIVNVIGAPHGVSTKVWANVGAISGAGLTLFTNFFGYKFFVFKKPAPTKISS